MKKTNYISLFTFITTLIFLNTYYSGELFQISKNKKIVDKFYPSDYELIKRTFPYFDYDKNAYKEAINEVKKLKHGAKLNKVNQNYFGSLQFVGPTNIGGRVVDIEFNPLEPNIVYAAAATGGVFKSLDSGVNWFPIFDDQPCLTIGDVGIDPVNPNIIYVGTGEANGGHNNFPGIGIFKSTDAGNSWNFIGLDSTVSIGRIVIDPNNPQRIIVAAVGSYFQPNPQRGVYLSEDGGNTWQKSLFVSDSTGAIDIVINPINPNIIYAAMWERVRRPVLRSETHLYGPTGGIYRTTDGGSNWEKLGVNNGLPNDDSQIGRIGLAICKSNPSVIYALYNDGTSLTGLYKTIDGGDNWIQTNSTFSGGGSFSWYFGQVRVHPNIPETVFVLDVPFLKSTSSGENWNFSYGYGGPSQLHVDHHALAFHPTNPNYILSGNDGGINISEDGGQTWSSPVQLPITQFYEIGLDKQNPDRFYGGTQDNNTIKTSQESIADWQRILGGDGFYVIIDPNNPDVIYAESQFGGLAKSINGGSSFSSALNGIDSNEPTNWSTPVAMDPNNSQVLYYGTHSLYRSENGASSWDKISPQLTDYNDERRLGTITTITIAKTNSDVIYVGTDDGHVLVSNNYGLTWTDISGDLPLRWVTRVAVDPENENIVYVTFSGLKWRDPEPKVFRSDNMGVTWSNISNGLPDAPVNAFEIDNINSNTIYLGNDVGVFVSFDSGNSWNIFAEELPIVVVNDLKIHPEENYLAIGTHGRGMYKISLNNTVNIDLNRTLINRFILEQNYPNPFNPTTTIEYSIPSFFGIPNSQHIEKSSSSKISPFDRNDNSSVIARSEATWQSYSEINSSFHQDGISRNNKVNVTLKVYDVIGREIAVLVNETQKPGTYKISFDGSNISSGVYYYQLKYADFIQIKKMVLLK